MKRKFSVIFILFAFLLSISSLNSFNYNYAFAHQKSDNESIKDTISATSKSAYLIDYDTKTVVYEKNAKERLPIASMCKIMTLLLSFEAIDNEQISLNQTVKVSENASSMGGSQVFLETDGEYKVSELIKSITVASANDACVAMAEILTGSEENFVQKMNERAKELGMDNTVFTNCTGLPAAGQFSCAKDVAKMFGELLKHKEYYTFSTIWTDVISHPNDRKTEISNTNKLIRFYQGCDSGKTGYTSEAGHCLCASAMKNNMRLISVVICAPNSKERFKDVSSMFNFGFNNYVKKVIIDKEKPLSLEVMVKGGKKENLQVVAEKSICLFSEKNQKRSVEFSVEINKDLIAPVNKGDVIGVLRVFENAKEIESVNVIANETVLKKSYFDIIEDISINWQLI